MEKNVYALKAKSAKSEVSGNFIRVTVDSRQLEFLVCNIHSSSAPLYKHPAWLRRAKSDAYFCFVL